jgi:tetratricopeptide (TPR) repeat protein
MKFSAWFFRGFLAVLLCASLNGCIPSSQSRIEEEKEPHFLAGKNCINSMDYRGAIEEFEKALEVNPHSASAHFQLGWLFEEKEPDPAAAIYHYQQSLRLRPNSENAEWIKQRIMNCKQDLAKTVLPLPITPGMQRQFEQLADENKRLREENDLLKKELANRAAMQANSDGAHSVPVRQTPVAQNSSAVQNSVSAETSRAHQPPPAMRTHTVESGDSPYSIAKKYGVKLDSFMAANPGLDPKRLKIGQTVRIPTP